MACIIAMIAAMCALLIVSVELSQQKPARDASPANQQMGSADLASIRQQKRLGVLRRTAALRKVCAAGGCGTITLPDVPAPTMEVPAFASLIRFEAPVCRFLEPRMKRKQ